MASLAPLSRTGLDPLPAPVPLETRAETPLDAAHRLFLSCAQPRVRPILERALARARLVQLAAGVSPDGRRAAAASYVATVATELLATGDLDAGDTLTAVEILHAVTGLPPEAAAFELQHGIAGNPDVLLLPPPLAGEVLLRLPLMLGLASELSLWKLDRATLVPMISLGGEAPSRRTRMAARAALGSSAPLALVGGTPLVALRLERFGQAVGAVVARAAPAHRERARGLLAEAATVLGVVLEREQLLERNSAREQELTRSLEKRLMTLGFDLHDGPMQDVLALGSEVALLRDQVYPFIAESHRELAAGRFDDIVARLSDIDRSLRGIAHSLESKSVVSRPLGEVLHREVDTFVERTGIEAGLEIRGDAESLTAAQRIVVFRALQESLANIREHAGARNVDIRLRARRQVIELAITDDGHGFEVSRALARAAQRGRLGLVGMGERVRMLGGTFHIESQPGGPTRLSLSLPRDA